MKTSTANGLTLEVKEMLSLAILGFYSSSKLSITSQWHIFPKEKVTISRMSEVPSKQRSCPCAVRSAPTGSWRRRKSQSWNRNFFISLFSATEEETLLFSIIPPDSPHMSNVPLTEKLSSSCFFFLRDVEGNKLTNSISSAPWEGDDETEVLSDGDSSFMSDGSCDWWAASALDSCRITDLRIQTSATRSTVK